MKRALPLLLALAALPTLAGDRTASPGLWESSVQMQMAGMPYPMPPHTSRRCITQEMIDRNEDIPRAQTRTGEECQIGDVHRAGNTASWTLRCSGSHPMQGSGMVTYDSATAYHAQLRMTMQMDGRQMQMTQSIESHRVGDCH